MLDHRRILLDQTGSGASVTSLSQLEAIDEKVFNVSRKNRFRPIEVESDPNWSSSLVGSYDAEVQGAISDTLTVAEYSSIEVGQVVLVIFPDGTKGLFVRVSNTGSIQYLWTGVGWDADGKLITRDGELINNPNTSGTGAGGGAVNGIGFSPIDNSSGVDYRYEVVALEKCAFQITIIHGGKSQSVITYTPC